jgi:hypothetical protein
MRDDSWIENAPNTAPILKDVFDFLSGVIIPNIVQGY